ncbi:helix-turn-helix domain-containing protein [Actinomadura parmotrematis]|uniref:Helix-turn-helix domain-containing protein n=1 Tax=Actinomadura parmotrematis TaxID=2864039 RepID=A0ABS7FT85_9ACTN|nr:helix-turn-helix transcriptional regulator [Actinomadura parmotrematis]MBW8483620.1 helix-turn-helix domain-containing protein [Actinomadura parmotrematis]
MPDTGLPNVRRRRLGNELRRIREERDLSLQQAARLLNRSHSAMSKLETGMRGIRRPALENVLDRYGITDPRRRATLFRLAETARDATSKGWWQAYDGTLSPESMDLISLEADAVLIDSLDLTIVPGLLQTPAYIEAIIALGPFKDDAERKRRLIATRLLRQEIIERRGAPLLRALVDEAVLHHVVGGASVMQTQLRHLLNLAERPNISLQILPNSLPGHPGMNGSFKILHVGQEGELEVVALDTLTMISYLETEKEIAPYKAVFDVLRGMALNCDESKTMIEGLLSAYERT